MLDSGSTANVNPVCGRQGKLGKKIRIGKRTGKYHGLFRCLNF